MSSSPPESDGIVAIARRLCGAEVVAVDACGGGGNNRVYRVRTPQEAFALKSYGPPEPDRDRLAQEFDGLQFLKQWGIGAALPFAYAVDRSERIALYEWIDGTVPKDHDARDIASALGLMGALHEAREADTATALAPATEAVLCLEDLREQLARRFERIAAVLSSEPELEAFVDRELRPEFERRIETAGDFPLTEVRRTLSASDFGFHNALRRRDGTLAFIDFEYFGWDDPAKATADFLWHPGMQLDAAERAAFVTGALALYGDDPDFAPRLSAHYPLYGIRWTLIVLNEFVPQVWARRRFSGKGGDWDAAKREQLLKARSLLARVRNYREGQYS